MLFKKEMRMSESDFVICPLIDETIKSIDCIETVRAVDQVIKKDTIGFSNVFGIGWFNSHNTPFAKKTV